MQQYEQNQVWTALEPDIASETAVLLSRPPQPLLEHPPKRTTFYVLLSRKKLSKCVYFIDRFCGICGGIPKTTKQSVDRRTSIHDLRSPNIPTE